MSRLPVQKTYKLVIGGQFQRTESGRYLPLRLGDTLIANVCHASRKDAREAVVAARAAQSGWAVKSPYNRGQILYRMAEVLEQRQAEFLHELTALGAAPAQASAEITASIDRLVWYAGWADKLTALLGTVNPVASSYFNFTIPEPTGVVALGAPEEAPLLGVVSLLAPAIVAGNTVVLIACAANPLCAVTFGEIVATSDLPGGVVNVLTGVPSELLPVLAAHMDANALVYAGSDDALWTKLQLEAVHNVKRTHRVGPFDHATWRSARTQSPTWIEHTLEMKTVWHPIGV